MTFAYLTFDCYGTLVDWKTGIESALATSLGRTRILGKGLLDAYVAAEKKEEETYQKYREVLRRSVLSLSKSLGVEVSAESARRFAASLPSWPAFPDTAKFLREAGRLGYGRYILSNVDTDLLEGTINNNGLEIDGYVTAEEVGSYKPDRGHWDRFFEKTNARKTEVLHVAQSIFHDIVPTQEMGVASAWVNRYAEQLPRDVHPTYVTDSLEHLTGLLEGTARKA
jgi:2-haloalkanoic acid dehalogenase type II